MRVVCVWPNRGCIQTRPEGSIQPFSPQTVWQNMRDKQEQLIKDEIYKILIRYNIYFVYFKYLIRRLRVSLVRESLIRVRQQCHEDIRKIRIRFEFFFSDVCFPRKGSLEGTIQVPWNLRANMEWKDNIQSRAEGNFSQKQTAWKERIKKGQTCKEQKSKGWCSLIRWFTCHKALAVWIYLLLGSIFNQRSKSQYNCCHNDNTKFPLNIVEQTQGHILEHHGGHSLSVKRGCQINKSNIQSNLPTQTDELIGEERHVFHGVLHWLWCHMMACHLVFTHPTAMASNFRSETSHVVTRLAWSGVGYGERGWFVGTLCVNSSASGCFVFLKIEENQENQIAVSNEHLFSTAPRKQNLVHFTRH